MHTSINMHCVVSVQDRIIEQYREMNGGIFFVRHLDIEFENGTSEHIALYAKDEKSLVSWDKKPQALNIKLEADVMVQAVPDAGLPKYRRDLLAQISYVDDESAKHSARMIEYIKAIDRRLVVV